MSRELVHRGRVIELGLETVELPGGGRATLEIVRHPGGAAVVAIDADDRVCLLEQYRHAAGGWIRELPAGKIDPGESPVDTARRELAEEAGVRAATLEPLGDMLSTPGFCDEVIHLYLATGLATVATRHEDDERIRVTWVAFEDAASLALDGEIRDAKTVVGLARAQSRRSRSDTAIGVG